MQPHIMYRTISLALVCFCAHIFGCMLYPAVCWMSFRSNSLIYDWLRYIWYMQEYARWTSFLLSALVKGSFYYILFYFGGCRTSVIRVFDCWLLISWTLVFHVMKEKRGDTLRYLWEAETLMVNKRFLFWFRRSTPIATMRYVSLCVLIFPKILNRKFQGHLMWTCVTTLNLNFTQLLIKHFS